MPRAKPPEPWNAGAYSFRLTTPHRVALARLGGAKWIREQIEKAMTDAQAKQ